MYCNVRPRQAATIKYSCSLVLIPVFLFYLVYPNQPVLCCVGLLQHIQFKVFVPDLSVPHPVITWWALCKEDH